VVNPSAQNHHEILQHESSNHRRKPALTREK